MAKLLLSVAPEVKTMASGVSELINFATTSLLFCNACLASCPKVCTEEGFPKRELKKGNIASVARGSTGFPAE
jgi:hypothetical protein